MKELAVEGARLLSYALPLSRPIAGLERREGLLVELSAKGQRGLGEAAPWPGLHDVSLEGCRQLLHDRLPLFVGPTGSSSVEDLAQHAGLRGLPPVVAWGLFSALLDLAAALEERPLSQLLTPSAPVFVEIAALIVNDGDVDAHLGRRRAAKVKVRSVADVERARRTRERLGPGDVRIDGNRALRLEEAVALADVARELSVSLFEEPVSRAELSAFAAAGMPLALDEALAEPRLDEALLAHASALVLKPSVLGPARTLALLARPGRKILSCPFESVVGRTTLGHLQAAFSPGLAAGLGTDAFLAEDLAAVDVGTPLLDLSQRPRLFDSALVELSKWGRP